MAKKEDRVGGMLEEDELTELILDEVDWLCEMEQLRVLWIDGNPLCSFVKK